MPLEQDVISAPSTDQEVAVEGTEATESPAEALKPETTVAKETTDELRPDLSYKRFAQIRDQRKEAIERADRLEKELQVLRQGQQRPQVVPPVELTEPPEHLSQREKVDFYVRQSARNMIREELGMDLKEAQTLLRAVPSVSDATYEQQWVRMCGEVGLDPNDRAVQDLTRGLVKGSGHEPQDALAVVADLMGKRKAATSATTPQRMENGATSHTMTAPNVGIVFDKTEARRLAEAGKRVESASVVDILKAAEKRRKAAG